MTDFVYEDWWNPNRIRIGRGPKGQGAMERACAIGRTLVRRGYWSNPETTILIVHDVGDIYLTVMMNCTRGDEPNLVAGRDYEIVAEGGHPVAQAGEYTQMRLMEDA